MLIWELSIQQVPYIEAFNNDYDEISQHVLKGKRESLAKFNDSNDIQRCLKTIISKGNFLYKKHTDRPRGFCMKPISFLVH
jgi:hypothetical protein